MSSIDEVGFEVFYVMCSLGVFRAVELDTVGVFLYPAEIVMVE